MVGGTGGNGDNNSTIEDESSDFVLIVTKLERSNKELINKVVPLTVELENRQT